MKPIKIFASLFLIVILASCNQGGSTSINDGGGSFGMWTIPGVGTEYIYENLQSTTFLFDTVTILKTGQHIGEKTNVVTLTDHFDAQADTQFYNIETNGDFSFGDSSINSFGTSNFTWDTYPTGSKLAIDVSPSVDSIGVNGEHIVNSDIRSFVGVENITVPAGQFSTRHVRETLIDDRIFPNDSTGSSSTDTVNTDLWFATSAGLYAKVVNDEVFNGQNDQQTNVVLIKYLPK